MKNRKILVVGGGGREHALVWKIAQSELVDKVYCAPGNGGTAKTERCENVPINVDQFDALAQFAKDKQIDLCVIGPDNPLADGIVDVLQSHGLSVFGPTKDAARLEASKSHAKEVMTALGIPTARYETFNDKPAARTFAQNNPWARVIKVDGLAYGKGVFVCENMDEVDEALNIIFDEAAFGVSGKKILIEERLYGEELSYFLLCDGKSVVTLTPCQDHKRRFDEDKGPNTGGMGAYSPVPLFDTMASKIEHSIVSPIESALKNGKLNYQGVLFVGILVCDGIPYVLEFNVRFGDPETETFLPRLQSDLVPYLFACADGTLGELDQPVWDDDYAVCIVACASDYPAGSSRGEPITIDQGHLPEKTEIFHMGTKFDGDRLVSNGGRVLAVVSRAGDALQARDRAYKALDAVKFNGISYRMDIARRVVPQCQST